MSKTKLMLGNNLDSLKKLPDNSIDSVVTDPPYGLSFMNKKWDYDVPSVEFWKEVFRVLKPGGHILSFGGTRTYHRMVVNIEDAGFEIRDQIMWLYGSGFPKSHNIGKAVDKIEGNDREVIGTKNDFALDGRVRKPDTHKPMNETINSEQEYGYKQGWDTPVTKGQSDWEGWGTALKPANEPICLARKPLSEKSVAENVLKWKTGGINVDGCRVGYTSEVDKESAKPGSLNATGENSMFGLKSGNEQNDEGRFPANIILECLCDEVIKGQEIKGNENYKWSNTNSNGEVFKGRGKYTPRTETLDIHTNPNCPCYLLDEQSGKLKSGKFQAHHKRGKTLGEYQGSCYGKYNNQDEMLNPDKTYGDSGGASRFFYQAKVSKQERNMGLDGFEEKVKGDGRKTIQADTPQQRQIHNPKKNFHPTVKPVNLMTYLCRLITPPNGIVLDPFMGSGSTGISARLEGFRFVGMEMDEDYFKIASARIENFEKYRKFLK
jgi:DNA modification methylase